MKTLAQLARQLAQVFVHTRNVDGYARVVNGSWVKKRRHQGLVE